MVKKLLQKNFFEEKISSNASLYQWNLWLSIFPDEEEEREYGKVLERMKEKFGYLHRKCVAVGKDLTDVRQRLERSWSVPESRAQPEEALRQEVRAEQRVRHSITFLSFQKSSKTVTDQLYVWKEWISYITLNIFTDLNHKSSMEYVKHHNVF